MFLFGGGIFQSNATVMLMAAESSDERHRSRVMYYIYSSYLFTEFIAPSIASAAMDKNLWIAFGIGIAFLLLSLATIPLVPETYQRVPTSSASSRRSTLGTEDHHTPVSDDGRTEDIETNRPDDRNGLIALFRKRNMLLAVPIFVVGVFRPATMNVLLQYVSVRFNWKLSKAALLISEVAAVNIVIFLLALPRLISVLQARYHIHPQVIDLRVLRSSLVLLFLGSFFIGISPNIPALISGKLMPNHTLPIYETDNRLSRDDICCRIRMPHLNACLGNLMG